MAKEIATSFEIQLFKAADKLRKNIDAEEYLGLIFLKYISDSFQELYEELRNQTFSPYDPFLNHYLKMKSIFLVNK